MSFPTCLTCHFREDRWCHWHEKNLTADDGPQCEDYEEDKQGE